MAQTTDLERVIQARDFVALYEMLMHLYKVARRYRLRYVPDKPLELEAQINLRTRYPLRMRLEAR